MSQDVENILHIDVQIILNIENDVGLCTWYYNGMTGDNLRCLMSQKFTHIKFKLTDSTSEKFNLAGVQVTPHGDYTDLQIQGTGEPNALLILNRHAHSGVPVGSVTLTVEPVQGVFEERISFKKETLTSDPEVVNTGNE